MYKLCMKAVRLREWVGGGKEKKKKTSICTCNMFLVGIYDELQGARNAEFQVS